MKQCGFCRHDSPNGPGLRQQRRAHVSAAQHLITQRNELTTRLQEPVQACQAPIVLSTVLKFRKDAKDPAAKDDSGFAAAMAIIREPWVSEVPVTDTMENAKRVIDKIYAASSWDIPTHADGSPADTNSDAAAFQLRYWAGSEFFPVWDPVKEPHLPVWVQDVTNDEFLSKCRKSGWWEMRRYSKISNIFPYSIPNPEGELGREVSTAEKEGASEIRIAKEHPLRLAINNIATLPNGIRVAICLVPRLLSLMKDIRLPNQAEQERKQSDTSSFDKDKPPTQVGFTNTNLPLASVMMFKEITFGLVRTIASCVVHHASFPENCVVQLLDALDTTIGMLQIYPSFPHCVGTVAALMDPEIVKTFIEVAHKGEATASLTALKLLAKLVPDLLKLERTALSGPEALDAGHSSVAEEIFKTVHAHIIPNLADFVDRAISQDPQYGADVAVNLATILRVSRAEDRLWNLSSAFESRCKFSAKDLALINRFLEQDGAADLLVRRFPIALPPRIPNSPCTCRTNEGNPQRSPVCHTCFPYSHMVEPKYRERTVFGLRIMGADRSRPLPVFDAAEAAGLWLYELAEVGGGTDIGVERSWRDCLRALGTDDGFRAAPGIPRALREDFERWGPQGSGKADQRIGDESAIVLGRILGNTQVR